MRLYEDDRLNPSHVSVYFALFKYWNLNRFKNPFSVARCEIMKLAKIKSPNTYSKCIKELDKWEYLSYSASTNPFKGSLFSLIDFTSSTSALNALVLTKASSKNGLALPIANAKNGLASIPSKTYKLNNINESKNQRSQDSIIDFFLSQKSTKKEALKFWNHYESNGWLIGGKSPMIDWQASAKNWISRSEELNKKHLVQKMDYLHTSSKKNYNESL